MNVTAKGERNHPFVLSGSDLRKLWVLLESNVGPVQASASCSDAIQRSFATWSELENYENPTSRRIESLELTAIGEKGVSTATLNFRTSRFDSIYFELRGTEEEVTRTKNLILEVTDGCKPWFAAIAYLEINLLFILVVVLYWLFLKETSPGPRPRLTLEPLQAVLGAGLLAAGGVALALGVWFLDRLKARLFPWATFVIGQGEKRHHLGEKVRWVVLVGFIISLLGSLFASLVD